MGPGILKAAFLLFSTASTADTPRTLPFLNYRDLFSGGYCLGMSSLYGFSDCPQDELEKNFGPMVARAFQEDPFRSEAAAATLLRFFSVIQNLSVYQEQLKKLPSWSVDTLTLSNDAARAAQEKLRQKMRDLVKRVGEEGGSFAIVDLQHPIAGTKIFEAGNLHSVWLLQAKDEGANFVFDYIDPNAPQKPQEMRFNLTEATFHFEADEKIYGGNVRTSFVSAYSRNEGRALITVVLGWLRKEKVADPLDAALLGFLKIPGASPQALCHYHDCSLADPKHFAEWKASLPPDAFELSKRPESELTEAQKGEVARGAQRWALTSLAAQAQLDRSCGDLKGFLGHLVSGADQPPGPWSEAPRFMEPLRDLLSPVAAMFSWSSPQRELLKVVAPEKPSELHVPENNAAQLACLENEVIPYLAEVPTKSPALWIKGVFANIDATPAAVWAFIRFSQGKLGDRALQGFVRRTLIDHQLNAIRALEILNASKSKPASAHFDTRRARELILQNQRDLFAQWDRGRDAYLGAWYSLPLALSSLIKQLNEGSAFAELSPEVQDFYLDWLGAWENFLSSGKDLPLREMKFHETSPFTSIGKTWLFELASKRYGIKAESFNLAALIKFIRKDLTALSDGSAPKN